MTARTHPGGLEILGPLGRGGTAEVVRVFDPQLNRECALKQPLKSAPVSEQLFRHLGERECELIRELSYPGIIKCYRAELDGEAPFILIELCRGRTMHDIGWTGNLTLSLNVLTSVAVSLEYVRLRSLVHGDIKPHNIFLPLLWRRCDRSDLFYTKLTDFSMGRRDSEDESARAGRGTVGYMAPETIDGDTTTHRSDLFSFGVMAYWFLTGEHPFLDGESDPVQINGRVQEDEPRPLHEVNRTIPQDVGELVAQLMAKDAASRPATAWEAAERLVAAGATYPIERALQPKYVVDGLTTETALPESLNIEETKARRLVWLSRKDNSQLRLILTANYRRGNMSYETGRFTWTANEVYWPSRLRRKTLAEFQALPFGMKRRAIMAAIAGGTDNARLSGLINDSHLKQISSPLVAMLRPMLSVELVKRYSAALAPVVREQNLTVAARLYCQAGLLRDAIDTVLEAHDESKQSHTDTELIGSLDAVIDLATMSDNLFAAREVLLKKADYFKKTGQSSESLACFEQIIGLYDTIESDKFLASVYKALGDLHKARHDFDAGLDALSKAMDIYQSLGAELDISHTYNNIGNIYWVGADLPSALLNYRRALRIQRRLDATAEIASTLNNIGSMYGMGGRFDRAINLYNHSMRLKEQLGDEPEIARTLNNLAYVYHLTGQNEKAVDRLQQSLEINERHGTRREVLINLHNLLVFSVAGGQLDQGLKHAESGMVLASELKDSQAMAAFKASQAEMLVRLGRYDEASAAIDQGVTYFENVSDFMVEMSLELTRARLRLGVGDSESAEGIVRQVLAQCREKEDSTVTLKTLQMLMRLSHEKQLYDEALQLATTSGADRDVATVHWNHISALIEQGNEIEARELAQEYLPLIGSLVQDIDYARVCNIAGEALASINKYDQARTYLEAGRDFAQERGLLPELIVARALLGRVELAGNEYEAAYRYYREALGSCKEIAGHISDDGDRKQFQSRRIVQFLVGEIKRLQQLFSQKNRQVNTPA